MEEQIQVELEKISESLRSNSLIAKLMEGQDLTLEEEVVVNE